MAAHENLSPQQFHEMTRQEFESQPGLWFHGTQSGLIGYQDNSFHVGSRKAAVEALSARIGGRHIPDAQQGSVVVKHPTAQIYGGHIVSEMTNTPHLSSRRGPPGRWEVAGGVPRGEMADWPRIHKGEPMSDVRANAVEAGVRKSGRKLRRGMYYINASEGAHEAVPVSAVIPNRQGFKTHEDYLIEARAKGKSVPKHVLKDYPRLGQGRLF